MSILVSGNQPRRILIIKPSSLGDIIHTLPVLYSLKKSFPEAQVDWLVARNFAPVLEGHPLIHRLLLFDRQKWSEMGRLWQTLAEIWQLFRELRRQHYDVSLDLSGLLRSALFTQMAGARYRLGFSNSNEGSPFFYNHKIEGDMNIHAVDRYLSLIGQLGCDTKDVHFPLPPYDSNPEVCRALPEKFFVISPSAGKPANCWPAERFGELAAKLPLPSVVIAGKSDLQVAENVVRQSNGKAVSLAGKTGLKELFAVVGRAHFMVTNDTGPMHIAAALKVPVFALFGPANPIRTGPYGEGHTVLRVPLDCSPCYRWKPCEHWRCMEELSVDLVCEQINGWLRKGEE